MDAIEYSNRAVQWADQGFATAFADAYRMPGYPAIFLGAHELAPGASNLAIRLLQMAAIALSAGLIAIVLLKLVPRLFALIGGVIFACLPFWYFVPTLTAEALTVAAIVVLMFFLGKVQASGPRLFAIISAGVTIAVCTYLKPNNLGIIIPAVAFLIALGPRRSVKPILAMCATTAMLLAPWILFAAVQQPGFVGLTTNSGVNLYTGTGIILQYDDSALANAAIRWQVDPKSNPADVVSIPATSSPAQINSAFTSAAVRIWRDRPMRELGYALDKTLIAFGINATQKADLLIGLFSTLALGTSVWGLWNRRIRPWSCLALTSAMVLAIQAALFQADRRFVIPLLFATAVVPITAALARLAHWAKVRRHAS